jgi:hypothetical protein
MIAVPIEYHANRIRIHTANETGTVFLRIAPIAGYQTRIASGSQPPLTLTESGILLSEQQTQEFVDVVYQSTSFALGLISAAFGLIASMALCIWKLAKHERKASICA